jgi:hypothetical protein
MPALLPGRLRSVGRDGFRLALRPDRQRGQLSAVTQGLDVARGPLSPQPDSACRQPAAHQGTGAEARPVDLTRPRASSSTDNDSGRLTGLKPSRFRRLGLSNCSHGRIYSAPISSSLVLISGLSYKTTFNKELWTSSLPLYSIKPSLRNLFMKKLTRDRVVPIISASVS